MGKFRVCGFPWKKLKKTWPGEEKRGFPVESTSALVSTEAFHPPAIGLSIRRGRDY
jgi:hypothetical protein